MKALVLAGGSGTRLRPITYTSAKQLVPVANKPVLFYALEDLRDAGVTDVGIVVGDTAPAIHAAVGDGSQFGLDVTYIHQNAPLGLAHTVLIAKDFLGEEDFIMYLGDNIIVGGITDLVHDFRTARPDVQVLLTQVSNPRDFGVAELDASGRIIGVQEKPSHPRSNKAIIGIYMFTATVHEAVRNLKPSARGELEITEAIQWLIDSDCKVAATTILGYWKDTGNVADLLEVNRVVLENCQPRLLGSVDDASELIGRVAIEKDAEVRACRILGPVIIGAGTRIVGSCIGPFSSIAPNCTIIDSEIEYSIVLEGSLIEGVRRIEASLIGRNAKVLPATGAVKAHRLVLADHSEVQISC